MNTRMILYCHSLSICLSILLNKIHRLVIYLEAGLVSPSFLYPEPLAQHRAEGLCSLNIVGWINELWKTLNFFYFLLSPGLGWVPHMYGAILHHSLSLLLMKIPFVKYPWHQCWLSLSEKVFGELRAWLWAESPKFPLRNNRLELLPLLATG